MDFGPEYLGAECGINGWLKKKHISLPPLGSTLLRLKEAAEVMPNLSILKEILPQLETQGQVLWFLFFFSVVELTIHFTAK